MVEYVLLKFGGVHTACGCKKVFTNVEALGVSGQFLNFKALGTSVQ